MARKSKQPVVPEAETFPRKAIPVTAGKTEEDTFHNFAALTTSPELAAYRVINASEAKAGMGEHIDVPALMETLRAQAGDVNRGELAGAEAMLMNQATALQSLFARLAERGMGCEHAPGFEANMRMALRAQSQCRATLETLANIKNPPVVYARQANVTTGPQQVNNGMVAPVRARGNEIEQTQLLRDEHGEGMDPGAAGTTIGTDQELAALGQIHRPEDGAG